LGSARGELHCDFLPNLLCLVAGKKHVMLFEPGQIRLLYPYPMHSTVPYSISRVNAFHPDYDLFPRFRDAMGLEGLLLPGDALFIPSGWWHQVASTADPINIAVNFWWDIPLSRQPYPMRYWFALVAHRLKGIHKGAFWRRD
jgi:hypothetical protein